MTEHTPWLRRISGWWVWLILAALVQLAQATIAGAVAIRSRHYDGHSVVVGALFCTGVELILTVIFVIIDACGDDS